MSKADHGRMLPPHLAALALSEMEHGPPPGWRQHPDLLAFMEEDGFPHGRPLLRREHPAVRVPILDNPIIAARVRAIADARDAHNPDDFQRAVTVLVWGLLDFIDGHAMDMRVPDDVGVAKLALVNMIGAGCPTKRKPRQIARMHNDAAWLTMHADRLRHSRDIPHAPDLHMMNKVRREGLDLPFTRAEAEEVISAMANCATGEARGRVTAVTRSYRVTFAKGRPFKKIRGGK